jgi:hypothetical protein
MQSESGILLLFYIFRSHENEKRGDAVSCPMYLVYYESSVKIKHILQCHTSVNGKQQHSHVLYV